MSGGFFRGTSAEQDTRFSNKQAKLLKTQKFAPELEHLVDITKVKMDVIKPWIAKRVCELIGFEDEVLINFIYGLLEGKEINGKGVQIQLTGFMEKNTGKFMKELWALLLSAQKNASGVPQQFLDAKEEETRKKKAETDRIFNEIQRRKEKETKEFEHDKARKMDGGLDNISAEESNRRVEKGFDDGDENRAGVTNGFRGTKRHSKSPHSSDRSRSPDRGARSRSNSKSYSNSRSHSKGRSVSRSISGSPRARRRSISPERIGRSPRRRSVSPRRSPARESISPSPRRRSHSGRRSSPHTRRRVLSPVRRRSPSPFRRRSPYCGRRRSPSPRYRSRSPLRRRSPSPWRRRLPSPRRRSPSPRRRSPSPWRRRRSPPPRRRRSPSPVRRRRGMSTSSSRSQSPVQRRLVSPVRCRFPSPVRRRSPCAVRRRSPSPDRKSLSPWGRSLSPSQRRSSSPVRRSSPIAARRRSPTTSPSRSRSPASGSSASPVRRGSVSPVKMKSPQLQKSLYGSPRKRTRNLESAKMEHRQPISLSPQRDHADINRIRRKVPSVSPSPVKPQSDLASPQIQIRSSREDRRLASPYESPGKGAKGQRMVDESQSPPTKLKGRRARHGSPVTSDDGLQNFREVEDKKKSTERASVRSSGGKNRESPDGPSSRRHHKGSDLRQDTEIRSEEPFLKEARALKKSPLKSSLSNERPDVPYSGYGSKLDEKRSSRLKDARGNRSGSFVDSREKIERKSPSVDSDLGSEENDKRRAGVAEKRKHKRLSRREAASDDTSSDSEIEDRKEAKRRRKEEKRLRKEERRRRREERRRQREEKRASKRKRKSKDTDLSSSEMDEKKKNDNASNGEHGSRKCSSEDEGTESQKKRLEIELRERALESLRAKKGINR